MDLVMSRRHFQTWWQNGLFSAEPPQWTAQVQGAQRRNKTKILWFGFFFETMTIIHHEIQQERWIFSFLEQGEQVELGCAFPCNPWPFGGCQFVPDHLWTMDTQSARAEKTELLHLILRGNFSNPLTPDQVESQAPPRCPPAPKILSFHPWN